MRFFGRAFVTGSQFGLCGADTITIGFDDAGAVSRLESETRYGVEGPIEAAPGTWTYEKSGRVCAAVKTTRNYFPAPDPQAALTIALYVAAIRKAAASSQPLSFSYACGATGTMRECRDRRLLSNLSLAEITSARTLDCPTTRLKLPECYELTFNEGKIGLNPQMIRIMGSDYMNRLVVEGVKLEFGETLP